MLSDLIALNAGLFLPPPMPGIPNCAFAGGKNWSREETRKETRKKREETLIAEDEGDKDVHKTISG